MTESAASRRRLAAELRRLRKHAKLTRRQVTERLDWSPSKVVGIEQGTDRIGLSDLRTLLRLYGVTEPAVVIELTAIARKSTSRLQAPQRWTARHRSESPVAAMIGDGVVMAAYAIGEKVAEIAWKSYGPDGPPFLAALGLSLCMVAALLLLAGYTAGRAAGMLHEIARMMAAAEELVRARRPDDTDNPDDDPDDGNPGPGPGPGPGPRLLPIGAGDDKKAEESRFHRVHLTRAAGLLAAGVSMGIWIGRSGWHHGQPPL